MRFQLLLMKLISKSFINLLIIHYSTIFENIKSVYKNYIHVNKYHIFITIHIDLDFNILSINKLQHMS